MQDVIGAAVGGREAGAVYEGDRISTSSCAFAKGRERYRRAEEPSRPASANAAGQMTGSIPLVKSRAFA